MPGCGNGEQRSGHNTRPNILFVFTDDHAAQAISAYGSRINRTPNIDRLADEGVLFRNCFCTNSICAPSRAVILTGKHSHLNGVIDNRPESMFDGSQQTFPKLMRQAGYQTAIIGKWHLRSEPTGFDYWEVLRGQGPYYNPLMLKAGGEVQHTGYTTDIITDLSLDWLENGRDKTRPFMLMCQHKAPHRLWAPGPDHLDDFDGEAIPEPPTLFDDYEGRGTAAHTQEMTIAGHMNERDLKLEPPRYLNEEQLKRWNEAYAVENEEFNKAGLEGDNLLRWKYQRYIKDYLRCVQSVDDNLGRMLAYLEQSGLADNTVVIYSSDQGFYLGEHGWFDKRFMYEESLRMPLLVRWPGTAGAGVENTDLVQNLDFAETFLDIAGAAVPQDMQGRSLVPLIKGRTPPDWRKSIYYHYYEWPAVHMVRRHYGVRTERYKLIYFYNLDEWELYDLQRDPSELRSLYGNPFYEEITAELKRELASLRARYAVPEVDPVPIPEQ
ncbi:MAG: sulfatase [Candidatus Glassbacteria bacterium]|nr:sulfatase [Candidatus Glassbacteria bacterium]